MCFLISETVKAFQKVVNLALISGIREKAITFDGLKSFKQMLE